MKIHSLTILHYGADYLSWALRSVYNQVDQLNVFYTPTPSHGHRANVPPIENKEKLQAVAYTYDPDDKIKWFDTLGVIREGEQRDLALQTIKDMGADIILVLDYDEIWPRNTLYNALLAAKNGNWRNNLVNMVHFWKSFSWACKDDGWPVRIINLEYDNGDAYLPREFGPVYHFGYAISNETMRYKWLIHGHKNELRSEWFEECWGVWPPVDNCHPTNGLSDEGKPFWTPEPFDKRQLPEFMRDHPFYELEKIK